MPPRSTRSDLAPLGANGPVPGSSWRWAVLAALAATTPFLPGLTGSRVFYVRDLSMFFWGRYLWLRHALLSGGFPLWDPYVGGGQSAVADALHQMFLLPALAVRLIGSDVLGFNLWVATPFPLAAWGAWLFFRRRFAADASALGAIAFSLSGPIVSTSNFPNLSWSTAAIPWVLWAADRVSMKPTPRHIAVLALVTALHALAGEPVTLLATLVLGLAFAAIAGSTSADARFARRLRLATLVALGMGLGLGVAAIQLLPLAQAASLSERSVTVAKDFWSVHPLSLLEMVSLHFFGDYFSSQSLAATPWLPMLNSGREAFLFSIYFGVPLLGVALLGLIAGGPVRWTLFWTVAGAVSLLSAFGAYTPVYPFVRDHLPLLPSFRYPAKYLVVWSMAVAAAAAAGWEALAWRADGPRFARARIAAIALALTIGALAWLAVAACTYLSTPAAFQIFALARSLHADDPVAAAAFMLATVPRAASSLLLLSAATAALIFAATRPRLGAAAARAGLYALIVVDLAVKAWGVNPAFNPAYLAEPQWLSLTKAHPDSRFYIGGNRDGTLDASDLDSGGAYLNPQGLTGSASRAALSGQANFYASGWHSREMLSYDLPILWPREFSAMERRFFVGGRVERDLLLARTGVRYRVLPRRQALGRTPIIQVPDLVQSFLFDYGGDAAPRVSVVGEARVVSDVGRQIEMLFEDGWNARTTAIIDREPAAAGDSTPEALQAAAITSDSANRMVVEAGVAKGGGYLVMLDSFSNDWRATVDGQSATIVRADGLFRAVRLNSGRHVVEFVYRPRAFLIGAAGSAVALTLVLGLFAWRSRPQPVDRSAGTAVTIAP